MALGTIWALDDSALERKAIRDALAAHFDVESFSDGAGLIERLAAGRAPLAVLLDWNLPDVSGIEVCRFVRSRHSEAALPVLMLTATRLDAGDLVEAMGAGANDFLVKPFGDAELVARVTSLVRIRQLHDRAEVAEQAMRSQRNFHRDAGVVQEALYRIGGVLAERLDLSAAADRVLEETVALSGAQFAAFYSVEGGHCVLRALSGMSHGDLALLPPPGLPFFAATFEGRGMVRSSDLSQDPRFGEGVPRAEGGGPPPPPFRSYIAAPAVARAGDVVGALFLGHEEPARFGEREERLVATVAVQIASALDNARLYKQAEDAARALREEAALRERFIAVLGHDLRNPLAAIALGAASLLRQAELPTNQVRSLQRMASSAARMERMIADLLDLARARGGGGIPIAPVPTDLHALVRQVAEELEVAHADRSIAIAVEGDCNGVWDPDRLAQVASNLMSNALQYSPAGAAVDVALRGDGARVSLAVHNEGAPIPPELQEALFDPFRRGVAEDSTPVPTRAGAGLGLGLFIAQQIALAHGGTLRLESAPGSGTTFTVSLPRQAPGPRRAGA